MLFASDSRLNSGYFFDSGPKIFPLSRGDCAIAFAGSSLYAYPLINHAIMMVNHYHRAHTRAMDLSELKGQLIDIFNEAIDRVGTTRRFHGEAERPKDLRFIFGGYDWRSRNFVSWELYYNDSMNKITTRRGRRIIDKSKGTEMIVVGEGAENFVDMLRKDLLKSKKNGESIDLGMKPVHFLQSVINDERFDTVGGDVQMVRVHQHLNCNIQPVIFRDVDGRRVLSQAGRRLLDFEKTRFLAFDLDTLSYVKMWDYLDEPKSYGWIDDGGSKE